MSDNISHDPQRAEQAHLAPEKDRLVSEDMPEVPAPTSLTADKGTWTRSKACVPTLVVFMIGACLLCCNLGARYLWQDEAATAVLGERMMTYGRPLAYDGRNLITMDTYSRDEATRLPTGDAEEAIRYHARRGDFKADTTWVGQPWGQFVVAGISLALFGHDTIAARLPFVLCGALTVALLFSIVRRRFSSSVAAWAAAALVLSNSFWVLHMRQCRYYALSSLLLLATFEAYLRWKEGRLRGGLLFIAAAWTWFQVDFGSVWPVLAVLGVDAIISRKRRISETVLVFIEFCAGTAPFCLYYELSGRLKSAAFPWSERACGMLFELNQFQLPLIMIPLALCLIWVNRGEQSGARLRSLVGLSMTVLCALTIWMILVTPCPFYRYIVPATTLSAIVTAYVFMELARLIPRSRDIRWLVPFVTASATLLFSVTNVLSWPGILVLPTEQRLQYYVSSIVRPEIKLFTDDLWGKGNDPNRATVEFLRGQLKPDDEIVCNYEDTPLMFYLQNRIRGGVSCFRVTDTGEAAFAVYRVSLSFSHASIYSEEFDKSYWQPHALNAPDIPWGNCPDPPLHHTVMSAKAQPLVIYERVAQ